MVHIHMSVCIPRYISQQFVVCIVLCHYCFLCFTYCMQFTGQKKKTKNNVCNLFVRAFAKIPTFRFVAAQLPHSAAPSIFAYFPQPTAPQQAITRRCTHAHAPFHFGKVNASVLWSRLPCWTRCAQLQLQVVAYFLATHRSPWSCHN